MNRDELIAIVEGRIGVSNPVEVILEYCNYVGMPKENINKIARFMSDLNNGTHLIIQRILPQAVLTLKSKYNIVDIIDIKTNQILKSV